MEGFVYGGELEESALRELIQRLPDRTVLSWENARLDFSEEPRQEGRAFNQETEVRWRHLGGERFRVLVISDRERDDLPALESVPGPWEGGNEEVVQLIRLTDRRYSPPFERYPATDAPSGRLKCRVFFRDGVAVFLSPREVIADEKE